MIAIYTLTSSLHNEQAVAKISDEFLSAIFPKGKYSFKGDDYSEFGTTGSMDVIYVRTGGAEGIFKKLLPDMLSRGVTRYYLLTSGKSNSLAASLEILSYLQQQGLKGEVLHGSTEYLKKRLQILEKLATARKKLFGARIGVIGQPSDWLIASHADSTAISEKLGARLVEIPMEELLQEVAKAPQDPAPEDPMTDAVRAAYPGASQIYHALGVIVKRYQLSAFTLRCFDLLTSVGNTGCLALAKFNAAGIPAACEGDVPALLSMMIAQALTGKTGFQANPARIDVESGKMLFAHCTVPFNMVRSWQWDTHYESGIGVGIHGELPQGKVTVFKISGKLDRLFVAEGELQYNQYEENLCRTQVALQLQPADARYFLTCPIGNHHIILPGHHKALLEALL